MEVGIVEQRIDEEIEELDDEEEEEEDIDDEELEDEDDDVGSRRSGRGLTLKTLLKEKVLEPGPASMTINYLGNKFKGDLLSDGRIRSQETNKIFGTPSAWAIYCKKIVNPEKKSGCGWASVRYRGKKLDAYKNNWFRQKRLEYEREEEIEDGDSSGSESDDGPHEQEILEFEQLGNRNINHNPGTMIELGNFQALSRMQPFNITMSSSAMAVIDVHSHVTTSEVIGYLAGQWDVNNHNLIVSHAFPVRCRLGDSQKGPVVEQELFAEMTRLKLSLVGWYHTHPTTPALPTLKDIDTQLDYEMKMKGYNDASYTPVLGIIVSPYGKVEKSIGNGNAVGYWVMPPPENKPLEYGRPMNMQFTVVQDAFIPKEALLHMSEVFKYYKGAPDAVIFAEIFEGKLTYWHKLKYSLRGRVPKDHFPPLIDFLTKMIEEKLPEDDPIPRVCEPPVEPTVSSIENKMDLSFESTSKETEIIKAAINNLKTLSEASEVKEKSSSEAERKTPPKSSFFPPPPLFPINSKDSHSPKIETRDNKKRSDSPERAVKISLETSPFDLSGGSKSDILSELACKLRKKETTSSPNRFLDLSMIGAKKENAAFRSKDQKDLSAWFSQAKAMQEAFLVPPHERENPFTRADLSPMFPPEFLTSQWNPTAAAAAMHLARDAAKASFHPDITNLFSPKGIGSSKPTYHSEVPLILKKQEDLLKIELSTDSQKEFRVPRDVKEPKDRNSRESRKREHDPDTKELRASKERLLNSPSTLLNSPSTLLANLSELREREVVGHRDLKLMESVMQTMPKNLENMMPLKESELILSAKKHLNRTEEAAGPSRIIGVEATKNLLNLRDPSELLGLRDKKHFPSEMSSLNELRKLIDNNKSFSDFQVEQKQKSDSEPQSLSANLKSIKEFEGSGSPSFDLPKMPTGTSLMITEHTKPKEFDNNEAELIENQSNVEIKLPLHESKSIPLPLLNLLPSSNPLNDKGGESHEFD